MIIGNYRIAGAVGFPAILHKAVTGFLLGLFFVLAIPALSHSKSGQDAVLPYSGSRLSPPEAPSRLSGTPLPPAPPDPFQHPLQALLLLTAPDTTTATVTLTTTGTPTDTITPAASTTPEATLTPTEITTPAEEPITSSAYLPVVLQLYPEAAPTDGSLTDLLLCDTLAAPLVIPDNYRPGVADTIWSGDSRLVVDLDVYIRIDHTWLGDLEATLTHQETGKTAGLFSRPRLPALVQGCSGSNMAVILDNEASQPVEDKCAGSIPSITGTFLPDENLSIFNGSSLAGSWLLNLSDQFQNDNGRLRSWCLDVTVSDRMPPPTSTPAPVSLPPEARLAYISGKDQSLPLDCESRSAVDWAAYFGVQIDELEFFNRLPVSDNPDAGFVGSVYGRWGQVPPNPYGVHAEPVAALLRSYGLEAYAHRSLSWDAVRSEVAAGRPVEVWVIGAANNSPTGYPLYYRATDGHHTVVSPYEHTVLVVGYTPTTVTILDGGKLYTRSLEQFLDAWSVLRNMAITSLPVH